MSKKVKITLIRSTIGQKPAAKKSVACLGLRKINKSVVKEVTPSLNGILKVVNHLVKIEEC